MKKSRIKEGAIIFGALLGILLVSFYDVSFQGKTFKIGTATSQALHYGVYGQEDNKPDFIPTNGTDAALLEEPIYKFIGDHLKKGILPLWNPHQACGFPLIAMIQTGIFFPLHLILYVLPDFYGWDVLIFTRFMLAGLLTYWFMRTIKFSCFCSLASAIIFMLSGPMVLLQYWTANVDILTPLLLICFDHMIRKKNLRYIGFAAMTIALTIFAGHPEHIFLVNVYGLSFLIFRTFNLKKQRDYKRIILSTISAYLLGACLSAFVLFPFFQNMLGEFWHGHPDKVGLLNEEERPRILSIALPYFFQKESLTYEFTFAGWWGGYLGVLPIGLALLSLFNKHKKGLNFFFVILGFLIISKAYGLFYINWIAHLPLFSLCRYAIHTPHLVAFTTAVAAGMGVRTILLNKSVSLKALCYTFPLIFIVLLHLIIYKASYLFDLSLKASLFAFGVLGAFHIILFLKDKKILKLKFIALLLVALVSVELFSYIHRERPNRFKTYPTVPYIEFLKNSPERNRAYGMFWSFYPNTATAYQVDDFGIFLGLLPKRFVELVHNCINRNIFKKDLRPPSLRAHPLTVGTPFMDMLNVRYLITPPEKMMQKIIMNYEKGENTRPDPDYKGEVNIYGRPAAFKRTYIVHRAVYKETREGAFDIMRKLQLHLKEFIVITQQISPMIFQAIQNAPENDRSQSKITKYTPNEVEILALMENPGFLVLSDAYHPDWKVFIDGEPGKIFEANNLIRAVFLTPGKHTVRYVFKPRWFYLGLKVAFVGFLVLLLLIDDGNLFKKKKT